MVVPPGETYRERNKSLPHVCELRQHTRPCTFERDYSLHCSYYCTKIIDWVKEKAHVILRIHHEGRRPLPVKS